MYVSVCRYVQGRSQEWLGVPKDANVSAGACPPPGIFHVIMLLPGHGGEMGGGGGSGQQQQTEYVCSCVGVY